MVIVKHYHSWLNLGWCRVGLTVQSLSADIHVSQVLPPPPHIRGIVHVSEMIVFIAYEFMTLYYFQIRDDTPNQPSETHHSSLSSEDI